MVCIIVNLLLGAAAQTEEAGIAGETKKEIGNEIEKEKEGIESEIEKGTGTEVEGKSAPLEHQDIPVLEWVKKGEIIKPSFHIVRDITGTLLGANDGMGQWPNQRGLGVIE